MRTVPRAPESSAQSSRGRTPYADELTSAPSLRKWIKWKAAGPPELQDKRLRLRAKLENCTTSAKTNWTGLEVKEKLAATATAEKCRTKKDTAQAVSFSTT